MRTTIRLDGDLLAHVKLVAARSGTTMTAVIEEALRETLARRREAAEQDQVRLTTVPGRGLQPGVDLDDTAALLALMEGSLGSS